MESGPASRGNNASCHKFVAGNLTKGFQDVDSLDNGYHLPELAFDRPIGEHCQSYSNDQDVWLFVSPSSLMEGLCDYYLVYRKC